MPVKKKPRGNTPIRQFRLDDAAMLELDALVEHLGVGTRTAAVRLLIRQEFKKQAIVRIRALEKKR